MKKTLSIIAALALALGMTQCKKAETPQSTIDEGIHVTFTATYGGERTSFNPAGGSFTWNTSGTEYIYVGCEGIDGCIGELTATATGGTSLTFEGTLTPTPASGATLHFFYLGNGRHQNASTLDFSSQDGSLGDLTNYHIAVGSQKYNGSNNFSATLEPLVAFAYFDLIGFGTEAVNILGVGVYSTATIDYRNGTIAGKDDGVISVGTPKSDGNYVALIPSTSVSSTDYATTVGFGSTSYTGSLEFKRGIFAGRYYTTADGNALAVEATSAGPAVFAVDENGTTVHFSPGNLQYKEGVGWRFAPNQWDAKRAWNTEDWVDLFGWGTWTGTSPNPLETSNVASSYEWDDDDFVGTLEGYDDWRTLTGDDSEEGGEWDFLIRFRENAENLRGAATVEGVHGLILLPDNWNLDVIPLKSDMDDWSDNVIDGSVWKNKWESHGAVFLPVAGKREGTDVSVDDDWNCYWTASAATYSDEDNDNRAFTLEFKFHDVDAVQEYERCYGYPVRLVR